MAEMLNKINHTHTNCLLVTTEHDNNSLDFLSTNYFKQTDKSYLCG